MQISEQKTLLAKLMATENIRVEHQNIETAKFDPVNRVMYLPIWNDMTGVMYDLLAGHEVGHALHTPAEGWHDAVMDSTKNKSFKNFLNVVEDARIEKKVQRKYPGLRKSFREAYTELLKRDFFGIKFKDVDHLPFIDRLNIFTKSQYSMPIEFSDKELSIIEKVKTLETWNEVVLLAEEIYEYSKEEQLEKKEEYVKFKNDDEFGEETFPSDDYDWEDSDGELDQDDDSYDDAPYDTINRFKDSQESKEDQFLPKCETDENYRRNESSLIASSNSKYVYVTYPKPIMENIFTPWKRVQELLSEYYDCYTNNVDFKQEAQKLVSDFKQKNERYISLLVKEFEMRKAAKSYANRKVADSGDIDINKLSGYKFDDNIFRKLMRIPKGKSHGLMLLLDYSGSMSDNMAGSIEQVLILTMFCRKVNIPFVVYTFTDNYDTAYIDRKLEYTTEESLASFESSPNTLVFSNVRIREYLSSDMTTAEYSKAVHNMLMLKSSFEGTTVFGRPRTEHLSNTPMTQALVATAPLMRNFKAKYNLDISNLVIIQDGDADCNNSYVTSDNTVSAFSIYNKDKVTVYDKKFKFERMFHMNRHDDVDEVFITTLKWFSTVTDSKIFGFYLVNPYFSRNAIREKFYVDEKTPLKFSSEAIETIVKKFKTEKCVVSKNPGYGSFFMISGGNELKVETEELKITGDVTTSKLKTAFSKLNKKKQINRVLVTKFIEGIAK